jgi:hypothetical protein
MTMSLGANESPSGGMIRAVVVVVAVVLGSAGSALAYPQFQLGRDPACSGCHLSPGGGRLLNENGLMTAESISTFGTTPEFLNGAIALPGWLLLGGDVRVASGYLQTPQRYLLTIPMQAELHAAATFGAISVHASAGLRPAQPRRPATRLGSTEHFVMWRSEPGTAEGLFARVGHFMPVFGLRFVEHTIYTRRYGGSPLFSETYGASASYIRPKYEAHVSGFVKNPLWDGARQTSGGAAYGELRLDEATSLGAGAMIEASSFDHRYRGTLTAKRFFAGPEILVQGELQVVNPHVAGYGFTQLVGYVMGSWFPTQGVMIDVGYGHYDENIRIRALDRDCFDLNVHWFATSHFELLLTSRLELIGKGDGGATGAYAMLQGHYRL